MNFVPESQEVGPYVKPHGTTEEISDPLSKTGQCPDEGD